MKVVIIGAGSVGRTIAKDLVERDHTVTLVDRAASAMRIASVSEAEWILADACEMATLETLGLDECDVIVCATGDDKVNLVVSLLAKTEFGVPQVVARINNPKNEWLFDSSWGVDVAVSTPRIMTTLIEEALSEGDLVLMQSFHRSGAGLYQVTIPENAAIAGRTVGSLLLPADIVVNAIIRDGNPMTAEADLTIESGDQVLFIVGAEAHEYLDEVQALVKQPASEPNGSASM